MAKDEKYDDAIGAVVARMRENWPLAASHDLLLTMHLHRLQALMLENGRMLLSNYNLGLSEFEVLSALRCQPDPWIVTPGALCDILLMSSGGLTKLLKGLEDRGLIDRPVNFKNRRSKPIRLTEKGREIVEAAMVDVKTKHQSIFSQTLDEASREQLDAHLRKLIQEAERRNQAIGQK
nr:MarR family winged helix-turn-helix transcriptional regulator [uncultured Cohaesibacter sp.]